MYKIHRFVPLSVYSIVNIGQPVINLVLTNPCSPDTMNIIFTIVWEVVVLLREKSQYILPSASSSLSTYDHISDVLDIFRRRNRSAQLLRSQVKKAPMRERENMQSDVNGGNVELKKRATTAQGGIRQ